MPRYRRDVPASGALWTLQKDANKATATTRTVAGVGVELRYEFNGEVRQSQVYKDTDELVAAASHRRDELIGRGWRGVPVLVISYSHLDRPIVAALVSLLKAAMREVEEAVYWDGRFDPGDPWFDQIKQHIEWTPQLFVFWCWHSAESSEVRREYMYALAQKKRVVPVLLDDTTLSPELAPIHGINLQDVVDHKATGRHSALSEWMRREAAREQRMREAGFGSVWALTPDDWRLDFEREMASRFRPHIGV